MRGKKDFKSMKNTILEAEDKHVREEKDEISTLPPTPSHGQVREKHTRRTQTLSLLLLGHNLAGDMLLHPAELLLGGGALLHDSATGGGLLLLDLAVHFRTLFSFQLKSKRERTPHTKYRNVQLNAGEAKAEN